MHIIDQQLKPVRRLFHKYLILVVGIIYNFVPIISLANPLRRCGVLSTTAHNNVKCGRISTSELLFFENVMAELFVAALKTHLSLRKIC
jgi:hypothetical protein